VTSYLGAKHWKPAQLQDLVFLQRGFDITQAHQVEGSIPVISSSGLTSWHNEAMAKGPGVVIGRKGSLGTVHYAENDYWPHDTTLWSKSLNGNVPRFVFYALKCLNLERFNVGGANPTLNRNHVHSLPINLPDVKVQIRIVEVLEPYDEMIEINRRRIALLEQAARLLYEEWFVRFRFPGHEHPKFISGLPDGWTRVPLGDMLTLKRGYDLPSSTRVDGEVPVVSSAGITGYHNQVQAKAPGIVTGRYGTLGQVYFVQRDFWPLNTALYVSDFRGLQPEFALHLLRNVLASWQSDKAAVPGIDRKVLHKLPVIVPPESLRLQFSSFASSVYKQIFTLENASAKLENARNLLLPRLMSGEVEV
jgi:type I restriction enzyme S subunit